MTLMSLPARTKSAWTEVKIWKKVGWPRGLGDGLVPRRSFALSKEASNPQGPRIGVL